MEKKKGISNIVGQGGELRQRNGEPKTLEQVLDTSPEYQLPEPQGFMSAKSYRNKVAEPLVQKLKSLVKTALVRCFEAWDSYYRLNVTNSNLHRENEGLRKTNEKLAGQNENLRAENKDYKLPARHLGVSRWTVF